MVTWDNICGLRQSHWDSTVPTPQISSYLMCQKFYMRESRLTFFIKDNIKEKIIKAGLLAWGLLAEVGRKTEITFVLRILWCTLISHLRKALPAHEPSGSRPLCGAFTAWYSELGLDLRLLALVMGSNSGQNNSSHPVKWIVKIKNVDLNTRYA